MPDEVEQTPAGVQDPSQPAAPAADAPAAPAPVQPQAPAAGPAPWTNDIQQTFQDPQVQAQVDQYIRTKWQPHVTQLEQQAAQNREAQQLYEAFQADPDAANVSVNRQLYGDDYADQVAASIGRPDLMVTQAQQQAAPAAQPQQPQQQPAGGPGDPVYDYWAEQFQQQQYDSAVNEFLQDPQYADIDRSLFDPFVAGASTWEEAVGNYRSYAAHFAANGASNDPPPQPPPTIGSQTVGGVGTTPAVEKQSLDDAIDSIFADNAPIAPPVMGGQ